jgi:hypothetical protein
MSLDTFEQSLLSELRQHVVARTDRQPVVRRHRTTRFAVGGLATAGGAAAVAIVLGTNLATPTAAFAVEGRPNGDVVVTVHDLADATALEQALAVKGVRADVSYDAAFTQSDGRARTASGGDQGACDIALAKVDGGLRFTLGAAQIASGARLEIVTSGSSAKNVGSPAQVAWSGGRCG